MGTIQKAQGWTGHSRTVSKNVKIFSMMRFRIFPKQNFWHIRNQGVTKRCLSLPSYMSPNAGWGGKGCLISAKEYSRA